MISFIPQVIERVIRFWMFEKIIGTPLVFVDKIITMHLDTYTLKYNSVTVPT